MRPKAAFLKNMKNSSSSISHSTETQPKHKPGESIEITYKKVCSSCHAECPQIQEWINTLWCINTVGG